VCSAEGNFRPFAAPMRVEGGTSARRLRFGCMEALPEPADQAGLRIKAHAAIGARVAQSRDSLLFESRSLGARNGLKFLTQQRSATRELSA
jgi:hypothetical protein